MVNLVRWRLIRNSKPENVLGGCPMHTNGYDLSTEGNDMVRTIRINGESRSRSVDDA